MNFSIELSNHSAAHITDFLGRTLGPKHLSYSWLLPLTAIYVLIFVTGLVGNGFTCIVIAKNPYMHTATNCYLFNLAVADMLTLICAMPMELYSLWHQYPWQLGEWACIMRTVSSEATAYASVLTIVTFSCEQYGAVCRVLRPQVSARRKLTRAFKLMLVIWIVSIAAAAPYGKYTRVNYLKMNSKRIEESAWCGFPFNDPKKEWEMLMLCSTLLFFVVPMVVITGIYARISLVLYRARDLYEDNPGVQRNNAYRRRIRSRRTIIRMLIAVVVGFFLCWAPYHSQRLMFLYVSLYGKWTESLRKVNESLFSAAGCCFYLNSTINPMLYSVMSSRFRVAFKEICSVKCRPKLLCCFKTNADASDSFTSTSQPRPQMQELCAIPMTLRNKRDPEMKRVNGICNSDHIRQDSLEKRHSSSLPSISSRAVNRGARERIKSSSSCYELARDKFGDAEFRNLQDGVQHNCVLTVQSNHVSQYGHPCLHAISDMGIYVPVIAESKF